ncbi:hypothetical protein HanIR_Chr03g0127111 [Helianthus annuus]|nr:hypothetical protein HanIR_Chr03g0127111 [Helianthus annuus]
MDSANNVEMTTKTIMAEGDYIFNKTPKLIFRFLKLPMYFSSFLGDYLIKLKSSYLVMMSDLDFYL